MALDIKEIKFAAVSDTALGAFINASKLKPLEKLQCDMFAQQECALITQSNPSERIQISFASCGIEDVQPQPVSSTSLPVNEPCR